MRNKIYVNDEVTTFKFFNRFIYKIRIFIGKFFGLYNARYQYNWVYVFEYTRIGWQYSGWRIFCNVLDQHIHTDRNLSTTLLTSASKHKKNNKLKQMSVFVSIGWHFYSICPQLKHKFVLNAIVKIIIIFVVVLLVWAKVLSIFWIMWFTR